VSTNDVDDLVLFQDVRILRSAAPALLCRIGDKSVTTKNSTGSGTPGGRRL
jgi:hypothetical protein